MPMWTTKNKHPKKEHLTEEETKEKALNLLEYRAHSRKELFDKLRRFSDIGTHVITSYVPERSRCTASATYAAYSGA